LRDVLNAAYNIMSAMYKEVEGVRRMEGWVNTDS